MYQRRAVALQNIEHHLGSYEENDGEGVGRAADKTRPVAEVEVTVAILVLLR